MKVLIVHDVYEELGGAERVLDKLIKMYPSADVFIGLSNNNRIEMLKKKTNGQVTVSRLSSIWPLSHASILLKPFLYLMWELRNFSEYDLIISSSHLYSAKSLISPPNTLHVSYIHTPPKYLYSEYNESRILRNKLFRVLLSPLLSWLRVMDFIGAQRPDVLIANSEIVRKRIKKYYRRDSVVIYPPVTIPASLPKTIKQKYYLCLSRLTEQKGIDLAVRACSQANLPLVVVGEGSEMTYLKSIAGPSVHFLGRIPDNELAHIYAGAKALIYCSIDEDFGIVPVEAMGYGVPIIGFRSGAISETVIHGKTGVLFTDFSREGLLDAIVQLESLKVKVKVCRNQAKKFTDDNFARSIRMSVCNAISGN